ncbi:MAG: DUF4321 domain-containing protein [Candidatus Marinimicrobia bacterium]|nr:DUF4321 domain-containing protein [FCB group bacterium]MBL7027882.1 DUF4321 domain-containing protein [Candidatus Neomarinimicrobiota bacterium]MBL7121891.1 DUF4321 domain-containing protein [Candidatus Neomarinimicrobiota bacterium]NQT62098.1 DUF4321 domain-containing protein [Candidatus Neomarinimicrobiota bacterium]
MDPRRRNIKIIVLMIFSGAIIGSVLGDVAAALLPESVVRNFFVLSFDTAKYGLAEPFVLDLRIFSLTFGFTLKVNFMGVVGMGVAYYLLRYYRV